MKYLLIYGLAFTFSFSTLAQPAKPVPRPKLVIGIIIDQMRWDYLYRYYDRYGDGGFKRLMREGYNCQNTMINYLPSYTAPGHACVYTGTVPAIHGIAANYWMDNKTGNGVYCTEDKTVRPVSGSYKAGRMSPKNLLTTTVTDELKLATNMRSRVYGIAVKDRGSILPAGHLANGAFWFDDSTGNFISSTYYGNTLPGWLTSFNAMRYADSFIKQDWNLLYPKETYTQSLPDNNAYEGKFVGEADPVFPHSVAGMKNYGYLGLRYLPSCNTMVFKLARNCIKKEQLGMKGITDFLCLSFSSPDYTGHKFSPNSLEIEDMFLRLDKELASFLSYLDKNIGKGEYLVFLTADHGAAHNPVYMQDVKIPAGNLYEEYNKPKLNAFLKEKYGSDTLVKSLYNYQVYFDEDVIASARLNRDNIKASVIDWLKKQDGIAYVADMESMQNNLFPEPIPKLLVNGYHNKRSGAIQVVYEPGWYSDDVTTGTTHGTWNPYDTHIPLLWYGWGVRSGETYRTINMTDIAPTLSALLHIQMPNGSIGNVIEEVMVNSK